VNVYVVIEHSVEQNRYDIEAETEADALEILNKGDVRPVENKVKSSDVVSIRASEPDDPVMDALLASLAKLEGATIAGVECGPGGDSPWVRLALSDGRELFATEPNVRER
jgi:hypothetical protein